MFNGNVYDVMKLIIGGTHLIWNVLINAVNLHFSTHKECP